MTWTKEKPTAEGRYRYKDVETGREQAVTIWQNCTCVLWVGGVKTLAEWPDGWWLGPLPPVKEE